MKIEYQPVGVIHTAFTKPEGMPIQPAGAEGVRGTVEVFGEFADGLQDLAGFSHIMLLYHFHQTSEPSLLITPFMDSQLRGVFATRAPKRPNPIGISVVKLVRIEGRILHVENVDVLDDTPLLDIKPYVPEFDQHEADRIGWLEQARGRVRNEKSDRRRA
ncbi:MAG: tRNA (N6-threonylcarbamoyladenosine(37)-N6)-methyltransferase TrmO [Planctomycetota bacterium]|jgi:tRNA-Thr(GGU) m(6)t(6)A37 methyltransferase TsaA